MPSIPKVLRRNSTEQTLAASVHEKLHHSSNKTRPAVDQGEHAFVAPAEGDLRSVCPALNTLANHGYLPRDGKNISFKVLSHALQAGYGISSFFANFLVLGSYILLHQSPRTPINLRDVGKHGGIEHNASLVHDDDIDGSFDAPAQVNPDLLEKLISKSYTPPSLVSHEKDDSIYLDDIAWARVHREKDSSEAAGKPVDPLHAEIARGEMAMVFNIFGKGKEKKLNAHDFRVWLDENRFPPGWSPSHTEHLVDTMFESKKIRTQMQKIRNDHTKLFGQLEKLVTGKGHGVLTAMWRLIETLALKLDKKAQDRRSASSSSGSSTPSTPTTPTTPTTPFTPTTLVAPMDEKPKAN